MPDNDKLVTEIEMLKVVLYFMDRNNERHNKFRKLI